MSDTISPEPLGSAPDGTFVVGGGGVIQDADDAGCALVGYSRAELIGLHGSELIPSEVRPATATSLDRMRRGELTRAEGRVRRKDGTVISVAVNATRLPNGRLVLSLKRRAAS